MDFYGRLGMYFFTIGALLSLFAGVFPLSSEMHNWVLVILIFLGTFSAILNVSEEEEVAFLVAASAFLITIVSFKFLLGTHPFVESTRTSSTS